MLKRDSGLEIRDLRTDALSGPGGGASVRVAVRDAIVGKDTRHRESRTCWVSQVPAAGLGRDSAQAALGARVTSAPPASGLSSLSSASRRVSISASNGSFQAGHSPTQLGTFWSCCLGCPNLMVEFILALRLWDTAGLSFTGVSIFLGHQASGGIFLPLKLLICFLVLLLVTLQSF